MARTNKQIPPIGRFGGVDVVQRRLGRSETLARNKEAIAAELIAMGTTVAPRSNAPDERVLRASQ